jgi:hypothetical protein
MVLSLVADLKPVIGRVGTFISSIRGLGFIIYLIPLAYRYAAANVIVGHYIYIRSVGKVFNKLAAETWMKSCIALRVLKIKK